MINKFNYKVAIITLFVNFVCCETKDKGVIDKSINDHNYDDFNGNPNYCNNFERNYYKMVQLVSDSIKENSKVGSKTIKNLIKYILKYEKLLPFYEQISNEERRDQFFDMILSLKIFHEDILSKTIKKHGKIKKGKTKCDFSEIIDDIYKQKIENRLEKLQEESIDILRRKIHTNLLTIMEDRADIGFIYAVSMYREEKLTKDLLTPDLIKQINSNTTYNKERIADLFIKEQSIRNHDYISEDDLKYVSKTQYDIVIDEWKSAINSNKNFEYVKFEKDILKVKSVEDIKNIIKTELRSFFENSYKHYRIEFSDCTLNLLVRYLKKLSNKPDIDVKDLTKLLTLYFLSFKSINKNCQEFLFADMGREMLQNSNKTDYLEHNSNIDFLIKLIEDNYNVMERSLFESFTGSKIRNGETTIMEELKEQLQKGKQ